MGLSLVLDEADCRLFAKILRLHEVILDDASYDFSTPARHGSVGTVSCPFQIVDINVLFCGPTIVDHLVLEAGREALVGWATEIEKLLDVAICSMLDFA